MTVPARRTAAATVAVATVAAVAAVLLAWAAGPAAGQPTSTPTGPPTPTGQPTGPPPGELPVDTGHLLDGTDSAGAAGPGDTGSVPDGTRQPPPPADVPAAVSDDTGNVVDTAQPQPHAGQRAGSGQAGLTDAVIGVASTDADGVPTGNYDLGYDPGAWNHWDRRFLGTLTAFAFEWTKLLTRASTATVGWAFELDVARGLAGRVDAIARRYQAGLHDGRISAWDLTLFAALVWCGWALLRGRTVQAAGELAVSWLVAVTFAVLVAGVPGGYARLVTATVDAADGLSASVLAATLDDDATVGCPDPLTAQAAGRASLACPWRRALHAAFVERPYDLLNWSRDLAVLPAGDPAGPCAAARTAIVADGPHGTSHEPRTRMAAAGRPCEPLAAFNADPTAERMILAGAMATVASLVLLLVIAIAASLIAAQLALVGLVAVSPFAAAVGTVPGSGRTLLWRWAAGLVKTVAVAVAMAMGLALYLMTVNGLLDATAHVPWLAQAVTLVVATLVMFAVRRRLLETSKASATQIGRRLSGARIGGSHGPGLLSAAGAWSPPAYRGLDPRRYVPGLATTTVSDLARGGRWLRHRLPGGNNRT